jgi:hypothetical protein
LIFNTSVPTQQNERKIFFKKSHKCCCFFGFFGSPQHTRHDAGAAKAHDGPDPHENVAAPALARRLGFGLARQISVVDRQARQAVLDGLDL